MAEDWNGIAAEVDEALRSIGDVSQPNGFPVTLRRVVRIGGNGYDPESGTPVTTYYPFVGYESTRELKDQNGTLIGVTRRTVTVNATGDVMPHDDDQVLLGQALTFIDDGTDATSAWEGIAAVRPLSPAGVAVLYEIDLAQ